ncbi:hypothetical protein [Nostoc sp.]|uniref:hypothetical protein n=1 Tax=Nostoc sp. TaxID=1180 RepID=UPI002FF82D23
MSQEEQIKGAIVVFPEEIVFASPELNRAAELACQKLNEFVNYIQTLDPELERHEATILGAAVLESLPELFRANPVLIAGIKTDCQTIRNNRQ